MGDSSSFVSKDPVFSGQNYSAWEVKMKAYLKAYDLWDAIEKDDDVDILLEHPTAAQKKSHVEATTKKYKALTVIHSAVSEEKFTRLMTCDTAKQAWLKLKEEYEGDLKARRVQVLNLRREFEMLRMKDGETVREFADRVMNVVNRVRLLGEELTDQRVVEKVLVSLPERLEHKIASLEDSKDLTVMSVGELVSSFQAMEQRQNMRKDEKEFRGKQGETALVAAEKTKFQKKTFKKAVGKFTGTTKKLNVHDGSQSNTYVKKKCKQFGHIEKVCKTDQQQPKAQVAEEVERDEEMMFMAFEKENSGSECKRSWLLDCGCTHHMCGDLESFKELDRSYKSKVKIGNGSYVAVEGRVFDKEGGKLMEVEMSSHSFPLNWKDKSVWKHG
ncbi:uncharacterized protein LOC120282960 [Dioscorea cayenensis subsp. rotundata]|uniref:Uncharacterized protein LOC120282960 n=1 Tax=Dioscorea cayennensis subsp. rotundata TaxID=55577 RepID=A0AB40D634_DIOCR|nr:uncharacterized protein LOC120282960 [Dioscorea cayenensis subsp. rotundata]